MVDTYRSISSPFNKCKHGNHLYLGVAICTSVICGADCSRTLCGGGDGDGVGGYNQHPCVEMENKASSSEVKLQWDWSIANELLVVIESR